MIKYLFVAFLSLLAAESYSQGPAYIIAGGPSLSNQRLSGFSREPFLRYHAYASIESTSEINPNSLYARLGYHIKGSAINIRNFYDVDGNQFEGASYAMEFRNASLSVGFKQRRELGSKFYYYAFGVRGDYNLSTKFGQIFKGYEGAQNKFTYGVDVDLGLELPMSELVSVIVEIGVSPDFAYQMFIPPQSNTGYQYPDGSPVIFPETKLTNFVIEARAGFRFWNKIIYTD